MTRITICRSAGELDRIQTLWRTLERSPRQTIFQNFAWNRLAAKIFSDREAPYVVAAESDSGAAIIPAVVVRSEHIALLGEELFDYRTCLWAGDSAPLGAAWAKLSDLDLPFRCRALRGIPPEEWCGFDTAPFTRAYSSSPGRKTASPKLETQFDRLRALGCQVEGVSATPELVKFMYRARAAANAGDLFADACRITMLAAMVEYAPEGATFHRLQHTGQTIASVLTFRDGDWERFYGTHYDRRWSKHSPGVSLAWWVRERTLTRGRMLDYMTGEQHYKQRLADSWTPLFILSADAGRLRALSALTEDPLPIAA